MLLISKKNVRSIFYHSFVQFDLYREMSVHPGGEGEDTAREKDRRR